MSFSEEQQSDIFTALAVILHLGNIGFENRGGAYVITQDDLRKCASLLGIEIDDLAEILTQQKRVLRGEEIFTPLDVDQV